MHAGWERFVLDEWLSCSRTQPRFTVTNRVCKWKRETEEQAMFTVAQEGKQYFP